MCVSVRQEMDVRLKGAPSDSLVTRLALVALYLVAHVFECSSSSTVSAATGVEEWRAEAERAASLVRHVWREFRQEMRFRWENDCLVPG